MKTTREQREEWLRRATLLDNGVDAKPIEIPAYILRQLLEDFQQLEKGKTT